MNIHERINSLIQEKNLTKREFSKRLRDLEPKLNSTGETPTEKTIYKYLDGSNAIKIELIPYIAEVLQVTEQELFTNDKKSRKKFFQNILKSATNEELQMIKSKLEIKEYENFVVNEPKSEYNNSKSLENEVISLLPYAPKPLLENLKLKLTELKEFNNSI
ncbi:hypothetical protein ACH5BK_00830 [Arcobacter sp. YIC-80]|uniref:hypothetical protein n=1 Tax=Arcobacter sp. YIC-80 TaxID=3376683 RepID=UPI003850E0D3